jgi:3D (Asp-Asp-Asp) domain-containing protein
MIFTNAVTTAYCLCSLCCGGNGVTASGDVPVQGVTVAAPRSVPLGTVVWIEGIGRRVVQDRTAKRFDGRWDLYYKTHAEAVRFGKRRLKIVVK